MNVSTARVTDRNLFYLAAFVRALATGMMGELLGIYLASRALDANGIGVIITLGLAGAALGTGFVTFFADQFGHRRSLLLMTGLGVTGALLLAFSTHPLVLGAAAFIGMVNGMGRDRGAALVVETGALPATASDADRTYVFARYNVLQDIGHALGSLLAAVPAVLVRAGLSPVDAQQSAVLIYAGLSALPLLAYARLSPAVEARRVQLQRRVTPETGRTLAKICGLFAIDAFGADS